MISSWLLMLVSVLYVGALFAVAYYGDRRPLYPARAWLRPIVYSLALAVYCSSWTFYGAVGSAARSGLSYLPIYLGPILLFVFGFGLLERLVLVAKERNVTSIADFIGSRFGKSHALAALVTVIAVTAVVPYLALQLKAVALSFDVLTGTAATVNPPLFGDSALYIALLLAVFAILFGTRGIDATEHHHGMMLAIAAESVVKLLAFVAVGIYALHAGVDFDVIAQPFAETASKGLPTGFLAQTCLAFAAIFCLPRQFQVAARAGCFRSTSRSFPRSYCRSRRSAATLRRTVRCRRMRICSGFRSRTEKTCSRCSPTSVASPLRPAWSSSRRSHWRRWSATIS
jgi:Na+/proline symporter